MKNAAIFFLLGLIVGAIGYRQYRRIESGPTTAAAAPALADDRSPQPEPNESLDQKLKDWRLTPGDIKNDLAITGQVVREKSAAVASKIDDARVVAVVKAKYVLDADLSALAIEVASDHGAVTLTGTVKTPELVGRATALALDTHGVHKVVARLTVSG
ncbi:MAG TPA: BON domain-containing protein [Opitutaceae bacterium]|nr:BON domain-containing protein [Opitutaceae bacterium]